MYEILSPHAEEVVVMGVSESRGPKSDERDAYSLAERLRTGAIERRVFKETGAYTKLRELARTHTMIVQDVVRVQNRIKSVYRSRGVAVAGQTVYSVHGRQEWLSKLSEAPRCAAITLYAQYDAVEEVRKKAEKDLVQEAHRHPISRVLETCPGLGPIRVAQLTPIVVSPARFRTKRQFWSYCGLGIVMRSTSDWGENEGRGLGPGGRRNDPCRLNFNHNRVLKNVFKGRCDGGSPVQLQRDPLTARLLTATRQWDEAQPVQVGLARSSRPLLCRCGSRGGVRSGQVSSKEASDSRSRPEARSTETSG